MVNFLHSFESYPFPFETALIPKVIVLAVLNYCMRAKSVAPQHNALIAPGVCVPGQVSTDLVSSILKVIGTSFRAFTVFKVNRSSAQFPGDRTGTSLPLRSTPVGPNDESWESLVEKASKFRL